MIRRLFFRHFLSRGLVPAVVAVAMLPGAALGDSHIGVAGAVQNEVHGTVGGAAQTLTAGSQLFQNEVVATGAKSMAQLIFLDETSLSLGPKSEVRLDKFVFDPSGNAGSVVLNATQGVFRFITGSQNPTKYRLDTAIASIGVRGTIVDCSLGPAGLICIGQEGKVILTVHGVEYTLLPGQLLFVKPDGTVEGPMTPDGHFFDVVGIAPFELYGAYLPGDREHFDVPDSSTIRLDELLPHEDPCRDECSCDSCD